MQKVVLTFGIIAGIVNTILWFAFSSIWIDKDGKMDFEMGETLGYLSMLVALSMIFFGVRSYRDKQLGGVISFGKAFQVGLLITLVASVIYVAGWMIYYNTSEIAQTFPEQYLNYMMENLRKEGKPEVEIQQQVAQMQQGMELYKNPLVMIGMSFVEIIPVGLLISLVSALILKRKNLPANKSLTV